MTSFNHFLNKNEDFLQDINFVSEENFLEDNAVGENKTENDVFQNIMADLKALSDENPYFSEEALTFFKKVLFGNMSAKDVLDNLNQNSNICLRNTHQNELTSTVKRSHIRSVEKISDVRAILKYAAAYMLPVENEEDDDIDFI